MIRGLPHYAPVAAAVCVAAGAAVFISLTLAAPTAYPLIQASALCAVFACFVVLAYRFPIHVRHNLKLYMSTVPILKP